MGEFLTGNEWYWRLARTIAQGIVGVVIAFELGLSTRSLDARAFSLRTCQRARSPNARSIDMIVGWGVIDPSMRALVVALVMAILSPIMAELGAIVDDRGFFVIPRGGDE